MACVSCEKRKSVAVTLDQCEHASALELITAYPSDNTLVQVFSETHPEFEPKQYAVIATGYSSTKSKDRGDGFELDWSLSLGDLVETFDMKCLQFTCKAIRAADEDEEMPAPQPPQQNAFNLLMSGSRERTLPSKKTSR